MLSLEAARAVERLAALIAQWRNNADSLSGWDEHPLQRGSEWTLKRCADELEAALAEAKISA